MPHSSHSNRYYEASGMIVLDRITPVITALFDGFDLELDYSGSRQARIALSGGKKLPRWGKLVERLSRLCADLLISPDEEAKWQRLIADHAPEDEVDPATLFLLARRFNDGHNLALIAWEGAWHFDLPQRSEFTGEACFHSQEVRLHWETRWILAFGSALRASLREKDLTLAATLIALKTARLLDSIQDARPRETVRQLVLTRLADFLS